jgi:adenylosuccinate synthase
MLVQLTIRRATSMPMWESPLDGIRVLALLPRQWRKDLKKVNDGIVVQVQVHGVTPEEIHAEVTTALADSEIGPWELVACAVLTTLP